MRILLLIYFVIFTLNFFSQLVAGSWEYVFKQAGRVALKLILRNPANYSREKSNPTITFFFGGGWISGGTLSQISWLLIRKTDYPRIHQTILLTADNE